RIVDRVHLGLERHDADVVAEMPQAQAGVLPDRRAGFRTFAEQRVREQLAPVQRPGRARLIAGARGRERAIRVMDAFTAIRDPGRQWRIAHRAASGDVFADPSGNLLPAGRLPGLERPGLPTIAPTDREIDVARGVRD